MENKILHLNLGRLPLISYVEKTFPLIIIFAIFFLAYHASAQLKVSGRAMDLEENPLENVMSSWESLARFFDPLLQMRGFYITA